MQKEETVLNIQFVLLDCSHLKFSLVQHCSEWQNKFTTLLKEMAARHLLELHTYLQENAEKYGGWTWAQAAQGVGRPNLRDRPPMLSSPTLQNQPPSPDAGGTGGQFAPHGDPAARYAQPGDPDPSPT